MPRVMVVTDDFRAPRRCSGQIVMNEWVPSVQIVEGGLPRENWIERLVWAIEDAARAETVTLDSRRSIAVPLVMQ